jgi:spore maturation protein CgeB
MPEFRFVFLGLSITSSWGNGHATTYRSLVRGLAGLGHHVIFLERDTPWYAANRDLPDPPYCETALYGSVEEARDRFDCRIREADAVIVGSYVPEGIAIGDWVTSRSRGVTAFYDIDTPVTLASMQQGNNEYLSASLIPRYDLYLSFSGGPVLRRLEGEYRATRARLLSCSVDESVYRPERNEIRWDLGYLGTYSADRQPALETLLCEPARHWPAGRFVVAGPQYPEVISWPDNVARADHVPPSGHRAFYSSQRFTLNITRAAMARAGYSPSVRLFEAAACGAAIISDYWPGLEEVLRPGRDILIARSTGESLALLRELPEADRERVGRNARARILSKHTSAERAAELEAYVLEVLAAKAGRRAAAQVFQSPKLSASPS